MSKQKREASSSSGREGGEGEDDEKFKKDREMEIMSQHITPADYHFDDPGPSHMVYHSHQGASLTYEEPGRLQQLPPLHTRGPGRPRIHPPKPAGISRPRGRPKGSKNKKPRKRKEVARIERPPKRPRGRPRKWPPEMWEGFQRTREAAVQQQIKQQQQQMKQHQQSVVQTHEMAGPSHMYMETHPLESTLQMQAGVPQPMQSQHSHFPPPATQQEQQQSRIPLYMQMPLETEQPQDFPLIMPPPTLPQELVRHHHHHHLQQHQDTPSSLLVHSQGPREHQAEAAREPEDLLWMEQLSSEQIAPPHTTT